MLKFIFTMEIISFVSLLDLFEVIKLLNSDFINI
jgi:hypothetical protein